MSNVDDDQIEQLRRLWDRYGRLLATVAVLALLGVSGRYFYEGRQQRQAAAAAALYAAWQQPPAGQSADALAAQLRTEYPRSSYASFAAFAQARQAVEAGKLADAEQHLRWIVQNSPEANDRALASLRLARVLLDQGKPQEALDALGKDIPASSPALAEIRGDIAQAQKKPDEARKAYQEAIAGLPPESGQTALIKLKLDALGQP
jgi:predicted negative regulator of RcsB-dependent stress response